MSSSANHSGHCPVEFLDMRDGVKKAVVGVASLVHEW